MATQLLEHELHIGGEKHRSKGQINNWTHRQRIRHILHLEVCTVVCGKGGIHHGHVNVLTHARLMAHI